MNKPFTARLALLVAIVLTLFSAVILTSCGGKEKLYILNWGEYIDPDLVSGFEKEYHVSVKYSTSISNEDMYTKITTEQAAYDIVIPSDYMIQKLHDEGLLHEIDLTRLENYHSDMFVPELSTLLATDTVKSYEGYFVPYFWGSLGIMYRTANADLVTAVTTYGWRVFFEPSLLPAGTKVGMYESERDTLALAELYKGYDLNTENLDEIKAAFACYKGLSYTEWGADVLKTSILQGNLDVAFVYAGDFIDNYYLYREDHPTGDLPFACYVPQEANNVYFDAMAIPTTAQNIDLAHAFIDYMIDADHAFQNASYIGYAPTIDAVATRIKNDADMAEMASFPAYHPETIIANPGSYYAVYKSLSSVAYEKIASLFSDLKSAQK